MKFFFCEVEVEVERVFFSRLFRAQQLSLSLSLSRSTPTTILTSSLPAISMPSPTAPAQRAIPAQNSAPDRASENLLPLLLVAAPATSSVVRAAARQAEEVKSVRRWES